MTGRTRGSRDDRRAPDGGAPARHAMNRWAWRLFRREWRQQLLVLALITVAVAASVLGAGIATNSPPPQNAALGGARYAVTLPGDDPNLATDIGAITADVGPQRSTSHASNNDHGKRERPLQGTRPAAPRSGPPVQVIEQESLMTGSATPVELRAEDPNGAFGPSSLALVSGSYPKGAGEAALTRSVASLYDVGLGSTWKAAGRTWHVIGIVENPSNLLDSFALVAPGQLPAPTSVMVLFDTTPHFSLAKGATLLAPAAANGFSPALIALVVALFGLLFIGMIAVAGFTVVAQRRLRALGMVSALGATQRDVRRVMVANGAVVGAVATLVGAVIGFVLWFAYAPHLQASVAHRVDAFALPWWTIAVTMVFALITAIRAARRPARAIAEMSIMSALAGRAPRPKAAHRTAVPGAFLLAAGVYLLANAGGWGASGTSATLHLVGGLAGIVLGCVMVGPLCIGMLALLARRAPLAWRLAFRDLVRYRSRSGAALSAINVTVFIAVLIFLLAGARYADAIDYFGPNLPSNQLVVYTASGAATAGVTSQSLCTPGEPIAGSTTLDRDEAGVHDIAAALGTNNVVTLETASGLLLQTTDGGTDVGEPYVATPQLFAYYGIKASAIKSGVDLVTSRGGLIGAPALQLPLDCSFASRCPPTTCITHPTIQVLGELPADRSEPNLVLTPYAVHKYGLHPQPAAWLIETQGSLTSNEINDARERASTLGMVIETKNDSPSLAQLDTWATAAGMLLALGVLAMTVGLIRSEAATDLRVLVATGASSNVRRAITAATAGGLGLLGSALGTASAYLAAVAFFHNQLGSRLGHPPVVDLVLILVALPGIATAGGWLLSGRQPASVARQPTE